MGDIIRTFENAITAPDALVVEMPDNPGVRILVVSQHGASFEAARFHTMMAGGGDDLLKRFHAIATVRFRDELFAEKGAHLPPGFTFIQAIE